MRLPKGPVPARLRHQVRDARNGIARFGEMFELATRAKRVGVNPVQVLGCNPSAGDITDEQLATVRRAVEEAETRAAK